MKRILVDVTVNETRLAIIENEELVELYIERRNSQRSVGNIYKGRVTNVLPGMQAAFVDIGQEKNGFLYVGDAIPEKEKKAKFYDEGDVSITDIIKRGQEIIVQVTKEPIGSKGARLTRHITLPGRYLVLMPTTDYLGVSRKINSQSERERLRKEVEEIRPRNMGVIVRTVAENKSAYNFREDINFLLGLWHKIQDGQNLISSPSRIHRDFDLVARVTRDIFDKEFHEFIINDEEVYNSTLELVHLLSPHLKERVSLYTDSLELFERYGLLAQIERAISRKVWLSGGGYIVIDYTEALTVIDVNTGKYVGTSDLEDTIFRTNMEAVGEIAKQLRLRNIGGIIIIDFIDMTQKQYIDKVLQSLEEALQKDRTKTKILGMTSLGLVELTRKKVRQGLETIMKKKCDCCHGDGRVLRVDIILYEMEKEIKRISGHTNAEAIIFQVHPDIHQEILDSKIIIKELEDIYNIRVWILPARGLAYQDLLIKKMGKLDIIKETMQEISWKS